MLTPLQLKRLQTEMSKLRRLNPEQFDDAWYQLALRNCGATADPNNTARLSSKTLTNAGFDKAMALVESAAAAAGGEQKNYWQARNSKRTGLPTTRQLHLLRKLYADYAQARTAAGGQPYGLDAIVRQATSGYHRDPEKLTPYLAHKVIEALKEIVNRQPQPAGPLATATAAIEHLAGITTQEEPSP